MKGYVALELAFMESTSENLKFHNNIFQISSGKKPTNPIPSHPTTCHRSVGFKAKHRRAKADSSSRWEFNLGGEKEST